MIKEEFTVEENKKLTYLNAILASGIIKNNGKIPYKECGVVLEVYKNGNDKIANIKSYLDPLAKDKKILKGPIMPGESIRFDILIDNFNYEGDIKPSLKSKCFIGLDPKHLKG